MQNYIGNNVRAFRIHKGLSQEQLADAAGVGQSTVSSWEASETTPRKSNIQRLIETFPELEFDDIFSDESGFAKKALSRRVNSASFKLQAIRGTRAASSTASISLLTSISSSLRTSTSRSRSA